MVVKRLLSRWEPLLSEPLWYLTVARDIDRLWKTIDAEPRPLQRACKEMLYDFFESHLARNDIALATRGPKMDAERQPIDTVVIHHTGSSPGLRKERLSAIELVRLYVPYFAHPKLGRDRHLRGGPIGSGHIRNGRQVFWPYHWVIRKDGTAERLLDDPEIGWHAGNWDVNCRSVAIALDNDYQFSSPPFIEIATMAAIINRNYGNVPIRRVLGHREINPKTSCPSELFLNSADWIGWKSQLLQLLVARCERAA